MLTISTTYDCKQRGKEIKKVLNGYTIGYNLRGKFYSMQRIKTMIEPVEKNICPF